MVSGLTAEPMLADWKRLYEAASNFRDQRPWDVLIDTDLFAVRMSDEVFYCSVIGRSHLEYGLLAYRGEAGLLGYVLLLNDALDLDESMLVQDCLAFNLGSASEVHPADRARIEALGLRFKGRRAWPSFRCHRPSYLPTALCLTDAVALATCLEQSCQISEEVRDGRRPPVTFGSEIIPMRHQNSEACWDTSTAALPRLKLSLPEIEENRIKGIRQSCEKARQSWEVRLLAIAPVVEDENERGFWGRTLLCVDQESGFIWPTSILSPDDGVLDGFLAGVETAGFFPAILKLTSPLLERQLMPAAEALGIKVVQVAELPELEAATASLKGAFGGR